MPTLSTIFHLIISRLLISFNTLTATQSISNNATTTSSPDLESGNQPAPTPIPDNIDIDMLQWRRIDKVVHTVGFGGFGALMTLFVNTPGSATAHPALYKAYLVLICLGLATSMWLSVYSIIKEGSPAVGLVQIKLIYFTSFFVVFACFFRLLIELSPIDLAFVMVPTLIGMLGIALYLFPCSRHQNYTHGTDAILFPGRSFAPEQG